MNKETSVLGLKDNDKQYCPKEPCPLSGHCVNVPFSVMNLSRSLWRYLAIITLFGTAIASDTDGYE